MFSESDFLEMLNTDISSLTPDLIRLRRDFHHFPEPGWCEVRTTSIIAKYLTDLGYQVLTGPDVCAADARMGLPSEEVLESHYQRALSQGAIPEYAASARGGFTGVIGTLHLGAGPVIALRFDIDALPIKEDESADHLPYKEGFSSQNLGFMHAC